MTKNSSAAPTSEKIRETFLQYFAKQGHSRQPSSRLIPENDPTLLFTNAGMNQFKNVFLGFDQRDYTRAATSQKCVRAGGKHNDLENVGFTARHHTFFEMLGNFSFGDYFKKDAIHFAWELITKDLGIDKSRLYVSVFKDDDEAADIWHKQEGVPTDRIYRFGEADNFWRMGETGPCGPCSEIFYDLGPEVPGNPRDNVMGGSGDRYIEFWNLVFMQFNEDASGMTPLPRPSIDTGMGLERLTTILQGEINNYHTDVFQDIIAKASAVCGKHYERDLKNRKGEDLRKAEDINVALRVLADHARAGAFLIGDGVLPSNEGRGYVLRRIMRRALRYCRKLSPDQSLYPLAIRAVIEKMKGVYPELSQQQDLILTTVKDEEQRFLSTLDQGTEIFNQTIKQLQGHGQKTVPGETAFKLYDTYGFPLDLTHLMAAEIGFSVDMPGFEKHMDAARQKAKASWKGKAISANAGHVLTWSQSVHGQSGATSFTGYAETEHRDVQLLALSNGTESVARLATEQTGLLIFALTPFYAESGGQVGDSGHIQSATGHAEVFDCTKQNDVFLHHVRVVDGFFEAGQPCYLQVTESNRRQTAANHSATHLLHAALRKVLGTHVTQAGSLVEADRLRFDFTHNKPLGPQELREIESLVNDEIARSTSVLVREMPIKAALAEGAMAMFGEKYGDEVRVIRMGDFSTELCGGTHVSNTAFIRLFKITSESGVSSGVRRIEALTGDMASRFVLANTWENLEARAKVGLNQNWSQYLEGAPAMTEWIESTRNEVKNLERQVQSLKGQSLDLGQLTQGAREFEVQGKKGRFVFADVAVDDRKVLSDISDKLRDRLGASVVVLIGAGSESHPIVVSVSKELVGTLHAGNMLRDIATAMGGKGGGRPDFAQGAVAQRTNLSAAKKTAEGLLRLN